MTIPAYRDIQQKDVSVINEENGSVRVLSGTYKKSQGAAKGEYVKVQYLDVALNADSTWKYNETPNDLTLFLYLLDGSLAANEALSEFEEKACAMLMSASSSGIADFDEIAVKAGPEGARFLLIAGRPLREPVAWGGPIVMNTQEELEKAFAELDNNTFIRHDKPLDL